MPTRSSSAAWKGTLKQGSGTMKLGSGTWEGPFTFASRFESGKGTNPEELIGAAHAGCFSMALAAGLGRAGYQPTSVETEASVHLIRGDAGFRISRIELRCVATVPGIDEATFREQAEGAKAGCPVSQALAGVDIQLDARLAS